MVSRDNAVATLGAKPDFYHNLNGSSVVFVARRIVFAVWLAVLLPCTVTAQQYDPQLYAGLRWRLIGRSPFNPA